MFGLIQIQIYLESSAVLILGSKPSITLSCTDSSTDEKLQVSRSAGIIPQRKIVWKVG